MRSLERLALNLIVMVATSFAAHLKELEMVGRRLDAIDEQWMRHSGGIMVRTVRGGKILEFEFLRIVQRG